MQQTTSQRQGELHTLPEALSWQQRVRLSKLLPAKKTGSQQKALGDDFSTTTATPTQGSQETLADSQPIHRFVSRSKSNAAPDSASHTRDRDFENSVIPLCHTDLSIKKPS